MRADKERDRKHILSSSHHQYSQCSSSLYTIARIRQLDTMPASGLPPLRTVCEHSPEDSLRHSITTKAFLDLPRELLVEMLKLLDYREITRCRRVSAHKLRGNG